MVSQVSIRSNRLFEKHLVCDPKDWIWRSSTAARWHQPSPCGLSVCRTLVVHRRQDMQLDRRRAKADICTYDHIVLCLASVVRRCRLHGKPHPKVDCRPRTNVIPGSQAGFTHQRRVSCMWCCLPSLLLNKCDLSQSACGKAPSPSRHAAVQHRHRRCPTLPPRCRGRESKATPSAGANASLSSHIKGFPSSSGL